MSTAIIQCIDLSHAYSGKMALKNVSCTVSAGAPVGLVGPNGAGKTTLLSILSGFLLPTSGNVTLFGCQPGAAELIGKISALPQDARFDPGFSIGEQLDFLARLQGYSAKQARNETVKVLETVSLERSLNEKPGTLSHGMTKRVAIAQALIGSPELILLDEPTAGLDPVNIRKVRSIISDLTSKTTFIISSHDLTELGRLCRQILFLEDGVMSPMPVKTDDTESSTRFYTIQMEPCPETSVATKLMQLKGVLRVSNPQKYEFIVEYNPEIEARMDMKIINCLADNNWHYRQLRQGKTLEEQLFFDD